VDQATIISQAIGDQVDAFIWRNYAGGDPDSLYPWFESGSLVNFNKIDDPKVDAALAAGRAEPDETKRTAIYEGLNRRLSSQAYNLYTWYVNWYVAEQSDVKGVLGPNLPDATGKPGKQKPVSVLAGYHQVLGIWLDR
jgi:peptide/nickel transport system substrate-binding protein